MRIESWWRSESEIKKERNNLYNLSSDNQIFLKIIVQINFQNLEEKYDTNTHIHIYISKGVMFLFFSFINHFKRHF